MVKEEIKKLVAYVVTDIELAKNGDKKAGNDLIAEVMALNALCKAEEILSQRTEGQGNEERNKD